MTLFSVAKKNIQGNFKNYLIYFISMIFSVVIYYTFVSVQYSEEIAKGLHSAQSLKSIFTQASVILILFTAVFIWVSNSFFTRRRKKEVGLYALLGLQKRTIARMMFYENLIMGAAALIVGIILGTLLSKLFTMILLKLLDSAVDVQFGISLQAVGIVAVVFTVMILFTSIQGYRLIYRFQLVELFQAEKEGEPAPKASVTAAILSAALLAFGYWLAFQPISTNGQMARNFALLFGSIIAGTYLLFRSAIVYLMKLAVRNKTRYYRGMNMVGTAQLLYRIKGNTRVLTMIALLSALTLCASSVGYSSFFTQKQSAGKEAPFSYMHNAVSEAFDSRVKEIISLDKEHPLMGEIDIPILLAEGDFSNLIYQPTGYDEEKVPIKLISAGVYNEASKILNREEHVKLSGNEAAIIQPMYTSFTLDDIDGHTLSSESAGGKTTFKITDMVEGRVLPWGYPDICIIISDIQFDKLSESSAEVVTYKAYKVDHQQTTKETSAAVMGMKTDESSMSTYYSQYRQNVETSGINVFTLGFLGLVFLAATGSIIYFKQLTEAESDKGRYVILRKIGVSKNEIRNSIAKQVLFAFALPLAVGILHSAIMLQALASINLIEGLFAAPILIAVGAYILIYLVYYVLTVNSYNRIVNS